MWPNGESMTHTRGAKAGLADSRPAGRAGRRAEGQKDEGTDGKADGRPDNRPAGRPAGRATFGTRPPRRKLDTN